MLAFGQIVLPIAALIAVGLLFAGIKLFFLTPPNRAGVEVVASVEDTQKANASEAENLGGKSEDTAPAVATVKSEEKKPQQSKQNVVLAGPVDPAKATKSAKIESKPAAAKPAPTKPAGSVAAKPATTKLSVAKPATTTQTAAKPGTKIETTPTAKPTAQAQKKPETIPSPTTAKAGSKWGVQIGAFTKEEGAQTLSTQAKKDGYATTISATDASGTKYYRVRVSAGDTREKAEKLAAELEKKGYPVAVLPMQ